MKKTFLQFVFFFSLVSQIFSQWNATADFPSPNALTVYCLAKDYSWGNITVGGVATTGNYPMFTSTDNGSSWTNIGPTPTGTIYAMAQEASTLGTKYAIIRDSNTSNNGVFRRTNTYGWQRIGGQYFDGKDPRGIVQRYGCLFAGVRNDGRGIYKSTNFGDSWTQVNSTADIYCFEVKNNIIWAAGYDYQSGMGVLLRATDFPSFVTWTEVAKFGTSIIGLNVNDNGNIYISNQRGEFYISIDGGNTFQLKKTDIRFDELKIPIASNSQCVLVGDWGSGIFKSTDNGNTWVSRNDGLPSLKIVDITVSINNSILFFTAYSGSLSNHIFYSNTVCTDVNETNNYVLPNEIKLSQNYPNPFNPTTKIRFDIPKQSHVKLFVYDILGREVAVLINKEVNPGSYEATFDGKQLASGVYFYRIEANGFIKSAKMVLTK